MSNRPEQDILAVVQTYLDGLYEGDTSKLAQAFHPAAHLYCTTGNTLVNVDQQQWYDLVNSRPSAKSKGQGREMERVLLLDVTGPNTALVKLNCAILPRLFTDYLNFVLLDGRWQIISKVYHFETV
ncbi:nuclear transport factor 2 family protein [Ferrovibrio sp.]|uniref:nuclear transport factor 2 family protein n=1 Tax=Ferrovibrio sp. TaxID=1917215 RepID=UPI003D11C0F4